MRRHLTALLFILVALVVTGAAHAAIPTIRGPLADQNRDGVYDASIRFLPDGARLVTFQGHTVWEWRTLDRLLRPPWLLAEGDANRDGVTDYVFNEIVRDDTTASCGTFPMSTSRLVLVDGRSGQSRSLLEPLSAVCWRFPTATYPTDQWNVGTVQFGPWGIVAFPMYATVGYIINGGTTRTLAYPSTAAFDQAYIQANGSDCANALYPTSTVCYIPNSHTAQPVFVGNDLLTLTTGRAFLYRPDGSPTANVSWVSGESPNSGRNYGYLRSFTTHGRQFAYLLGGCTVWNARHAMTTGELPPDIGPRGACSIHRHIEQFEISGDTIVSHFNRYYSYVGTDGFFTDRLEAPAQSGPTVVYNLFHHGQWQTHVIADPARPDRETVIPRTYTWGILNGRLFTSHANGYIPEWKTLTRSLTGAIVSRAAGVPALVQYPDTSTSHFYDDLPHDLVGITRADSSFGVFTSHQGLLMQRHDGQRFWLAIDQKHS